MVTGELFQVVPQHGDGQKEQQIKISRFGTRNVETQTFKWHVSG